MYRALVSDPRAQDVEGINQASVEAARMHSSEEEEEASGPDLAQGSYS